MKNLFRITFIAILSLALFCGCSSDEPVIEENFPEETSQEKWDRDPFEHWQNGENGEKLNAAEHEMGEDFLCKICGCRVTDWGDGTFNVDNYDENFNVIRSTAYDSDGSFDDYTYEYGYDEDGNIISAKEYENGKLFAEYEYAIDNNGNHLPVNSTVYFSDGIKTVTEYNDNGDIEKEVSYFADGSLYYESFYEYAVSSDGFSYCVKISETDHSENLKYYYSYNEMDDCISYESTEYEYNEEGWVIYKKLYVNGLPSEENYFGIFDDGEGGRWTYYEKQILYNEDGSYTVCEYDEYDELLSKTAFDADGNKI